MDTKVRRDATISAVGLPSKCIARTGHVEKPYWHVCVSPPHTGADVQRRPRSFCCVVFCCVDRIVQSGPGGAEEAGDRTRSGCSRPGLPGGEAVLAVQKRTVRRSEPDPCGCRLKDINEPSSCSSCNKLYMLLFCSTWTQRGRRWKSKTNSQQLNVFEIYSVFFLFVQLSFYLLLKSWSKS